LPDAYRNHRTVVWLRDHFLPTNRARRDKVMRWRDEVSWCLRYQDLEGEPWQDSALSSARMAIPPVPRSDVREKARKLSDEPWARQILQSYRRDARTPIEVYSLLE